jgi:EmrB/QacA subfamily drug resistance transporter
MQDASPKSSKAAVLALASAASFMVALDALVVTTALGAIRQELGASIDALQWTMNAYNLCFAVLLLTGAALGDRFGRRRVFALGIALFTAASTACALAASPGSLIAARAVQGGSAALVMPLAMALLSAAFPREQRGRALGIFSGVTGLALIAGPVVGGAVAEGLAWQWIFWINVPIGLVLFPLVLARFDESHGGDARLDLVGLALVAGASLGLVWGLMRGNDAGWASLEVIAVLAAGVLLTIAFVGWELRTREPMLPMRLFAARAFSAGNAANFLYSASLYGTLFFMAQFFQTVLAQRPLGAGLRLLPWTATLLVTAPVAGALVNRVGERALVVAGLILQAAGLIWAGLLVAPGLAYAELVLPLIVAGCGVSMAMPAAQSAVLGAVTPEEIGKASGAFNTLRFLGGVIGIALAVAAFAHAGSLATPQTFSNGFALAIRLCAALSLAGALAGMALPGKRSVVLAQAEASV